MSAGSPIYGLCPAPGTEHGTLFLAESYLVDPASSHMLVSSTLSTKPWALHLYAIKYYKYTIMAGDQNPLDCVARWQI